MIRSEKGSALPWALFMLALILIIGSIYVKSINNDISANTKMADEVVLRYITEAGINHGISEYIDRDTAGIFPIAGELTDVSGTYKVEYTTPDTIISTGTYKNKQMIISIKIDSAGNITDWQEKLQ